ncbi:energy transducer TonB [uncultured Polaribacter sp.]|uniref:energy transducer TonB n=1 Tax=uncultured Polaribacter sp. TaxID=174711 RepID=UPI00260DB995|nr:energy transducer TonB [uncultured Polaribacter sp.]
MAILDTAHKRKSALITALILILLIFGIYNYGMQYLDPPEEYGLAINFGDSNVGSGEPVVKSKKTEFKKIDKVEEVVDEVEETAKEVVNEELVTQETTKEVPVVEKVKELKKEPTKEEVKKVEVKKKPKPKPSKENQDALNKLLNGNDVSGDPKGEGDDKVEGVKGKKGGDEKSSKYYGNTGSGSGGNYNLSGRKALSKPINQPDCNEEGIVVVKIRVNKNGKVIYAKAGEKGTTNSKPCLAKPAEAAALKTTWNPDSDAPAVQTGTIIYKFSLSK